MAIKIKRMKIREWLRLLKFWTVLDVVLGIFYVFFVICDMFMGLPNCELMYEKLANLQWEI